MKTPIAYGIDFGTTNSALAVAFDDGTTQVLGVDAGEQLLPSVVYLHRNQNRLAGNEALATFLVTGSDRTRCRGCTLVSWDAGEPATDCRQCRSGGFCLDSRLISQVKSSLSEDPRFVTHSWAADFHLEDLVAVVLRRLKVAADRSLEAEIDRVVLGHPVRFVGAAGPEFESTQRLAQDRLRRAAERAGFTDVVLLPESQAAVAVDGIDEGFVVCTDFGGGTFDTAVIDLRADAALVIALDGVAVGGEEFDAKIFDGVVGPALGLDQTFSRRDGGTRQLAAHVRRKLRSLSGLRTLLSHGDASVALSQFVELDHDGELARLIGELIYGGQAVAFYGAIETAKKELSDADKTSVTFRRPWIDLEIPLARATFEALIASDLALVRRCLEDSCAGAKIEPSDVDFVTKTGGSSRIPAFDALLRSTFPSAEIIERDPFTCVVTGLAEYAAEEWADE